MFLFAKIKIMIEIAKKYFFEGLKKIKMSKS